VSNFLQRQIARAGAGLSAVVRPRLPSLFEPAPRDQPALELEAPGLAVESDAQPAAIRRRGPTLAPDDARVEDPMRAPSTERRDEAADRTPLAPSRAGRKTGASPLEGFFSRHDDGPRAEPEAPRSPRAAGAIGAAAPPKEARSLPRAPTREMTMEAARPTTLEEPPPPARRAERHPMLAPNEHASSRPIAPRPRSIAIDAWSAPTLRTREVASPAPVTRGPSPRALPLREPPRPPAPTIEITIGRIEVKAASPVAPPARRPAARGPSELETYLRGKGGRRS
jgi:hypothetical protein